MNFRSSLRLLFAPTLLAAAAIAQIGPDSRANYQPMFLPSGPQGQLTVFELHGGAPPVIGQVTSMHVQAPGFLFGGVIASFDAHAAQPILLGGGTELLLYIDPLLLLANLPMPLAGGFGNVQLPLPPDPLLSGLDLAWQAWAVDANGQLGTSNLLACNVGTSPFSGAAQFASFAFGPVNIPRHSYYETNSVKQAIVSNESGAKVNYTITGNKPGNTGPLEIRDGTGAVVSTIAAADTVISKTISVAAGTKLYWYNADNAAINGLTWSVQAH